MSAVKKVTKGVTSTAPSPRRTSAPKRPWGTQNTISGALPSNASRPHIIKVQAEAPAKRVRFYLFNTSSLAEYGNIKISVAPTEKFARDTIANAWSRWEGGVVSNVVSSPTVPNGFRQVTWDGAPASAMVPMANSVLPSFGLPVAACIVSDWVEVGALPATDFGSGDKYAYIFRFYGIADASNNTVMSTISTSWTNGYLAAFDATPADYRLVMGISSSISGDPVADPTVLPGVVGSGISLPYFGWEFDYGIETTSILAVGDSITEAFKWPYIGVARKSTPAKPWDVVNIGGSSTRTKDFTANLWSHMQIMPKPDYVLYPSMSVNNYSPLSDFTVAAAQFEFKRLLEVVDQLNYRGVKPIIWTCYNFGVDTDQTTPIGIVNSNVRALCATGKAILMDVNRDPRFNRTIYNASTNPGGMINPDGTHPSDPTGIAFFATLLAETLAPL